MQRIQKGKFIMKKAISVLMIAACMLCMVTACEKKDKKGNDTSAAQETETDCTAAELVTTEPEGEITISEMIDQRIKEEGKIMIYRMCIAESNTPVEITEDLKVNIISYDGEKLKSYDNPDDFLMETRLGDIIHNKVDYSTYDIGAYDGKTYMTFCVRDNLNLIKYYIIPDNKFTENKTFVYDTPGTEETTVNTVDYLKKYQAVPKEELEQMIVFPGNKRAESSQAAD